ncbi:MAG: hypothetical protein QOC60_986 [Frankiaceae bacterium]|nr:hypothetical protein [Frankiaceae bacterium]
MSPVASILDAILPDTCVGCARPGGALCRPCLAALHNELPRRRDPTPRPRGLPPVTAAGTYAGTLRTALLSYKERGRTRLAEPLARLLAAAIVTAFCAAEVAGPMVIVGVPSTARARRDRGHDHVETLAAAAVISLRAAGIPAVRLRALRRRGSVRDSAGLSADERAHNAGSAFVVRRRARRDVSGRTVLVVDDIVTTGSTAAAVTLALEAAGARVAGVAVVAATARRCLVKADVEV